MLYILILKHTILFYFSIKQDCYLISWWFFFQKDHTRENILFPKDVILEHFFATFQHICICTYSQIFDLLPNRPKNINIEEFLFFYMERKKDRERVISNNISLKHLLHQV